MKRELNYFEIEGRYGGDQEWFTYFTMRCGGCGAATAIELLIYLAKERRGLRGLYPYGLESLTKADYNRFGKRMRPYLKPRKGGISELWMYTQGFAQYLEEEAGCRGLLAFEEFDGNRSLKEAKDFVRRFIDAGMPVPYLLLRHQEEEFADFTWHWFLLTGYEETEEGFFVIFGTYGERYTADFARLWDTGHGHRGGMVGVTVTQEALPETPERDSRTV